MIGNANAAESKSAAKDVILVLDASGSMWGKIKGKAKITIARDVIKKMLKTWNKDTRLGLLAYGHRRKGDCKDIQQIVPVSLVNAKNIMLKLKKISPKGKTPLSAAVKQAAEILKYTEDRATVILISDGKETCNVDPCKLGTELEKKGVDFTAHVIGFDVNKKKDIAQLKCLANNTGGKFFTAKNAAGLATAINKVVKAAEKEKTGLMISALKTKGGTPLSADWNLYDPSKKRIAYKYNTKKAFFELAPGKYRIQAKVGSASGDKEITIEKDKTTNELLILGAGQLDLKTVMIKGGSNLSANWQILKKNVDNSFKKIAYTYNSKNYKVTVPAGKYTVNVKISSSEKSEVVQVKAGETTNHTIILGSGRIVLSAILNTGGAVVSTNWQIFETLKNDLGKVKKVAYTYNSKAFAIILAAGKYQVEAKSGNAIKSEIIEVIAGKSIDHTVNLAAGRVALTAVMAPGGSKLSTNWNVFELNPDGKPGKKVTYTYNSKIFNMTLPAGKYIAQAISGKASKSLELVISEGKVTTLEVDLQAGNVNLNAKMAGALVNANWNITNAVKNDLGKYKKITYSYNRKSFNVMLPAGKYIVTVTAQKKTANLEIDVPAGKTTNFNIEIK